MPLLTLPNELLVDIYKQLISLVQSSAPDPYTANRIRTVAKPLVKLDRSLQTLCSINKRLRTVFVRDLYKKVTFDLKRNELQAQSAAVFQFLQDVETFGISRFIRCVAC